MEAMYATDLGLQNRYEALLLDNSIDPLDAISKTNKKAPKKSKPKKDPSAKATAKSEQEQIKTKDSEAQNKKSEEPAAKPKKPAKAAVPEKSIEVSFERLLTLAEYREKQTRITPLYNLRKPGEGEDLSQWENLVPLEKKKHGEEKEEVVNEASEIPQRARRVTNLPVRVTLGDSLVRKATTRRDVTAARLAVVVTASADAEPVQRQLPPKLNEKEFPTLG